MRLGFYQMHKMKRKQNLFLFLTKNEDDTPSNRVNLNLARLYVNRFIIEEEDQCEIQAVIPLIAHRYDTVDEKEEADQDAVLEQLERLGYEYVTEKSYLTHFILDTSFHNSIKEWIYLWFNQQALKNRKHFNIVNNFVCTTFTGQRGTICTNEQIVNIYNLSRGNKPFVSLETNGMITYTSKPVDIDMQTFQKKLTVDQRPENSLVNHFNEINDVQGLFYYQLLAEAEIQKMTI